MLRRSPSPSSLPRRRPALLTGLVVLLPLLLATAGPATAGPEVRRLSGADRFETSVVVSRTSHPGGAPVALLTTGATFPDALAGGPAAAQLGGPVLLTARDSVPSVVLEELRRLRPQRVIVLGGRAAVSDTATAQLTNASFAVERVAGEGRYETAALVSQLAFAPGTPVAYVATGAAYADALAGAAAAARQDAPVLLVGPDALPGSTARELQRLQPQRVVLLGGTGAVSERVEQALRSLVPSVTRVAGADRYATAAAVARTTPGPVGGVFLATGQGFADALSGGPAAAAASAPVLLVPRSCIPAAVHAELERVAYPPVTLLGGTAAVASRVADLVPCNRYPDGELAPGVRLTTINDARGPWRGKVVTVSPSAVWRLDTVLAQDALPGLETTSSMARRTSALVAVNGDFALAGGRPAHAFAKDGRLLQTPQVLGNNVAVEASSGLPHLGQPTVTVTMRVEATGETAPISKVNSGPSARTSLALRTPEGGTAAPVPGSSCAVRLASQGAPATQADGRVVRNYAVRESACGTDPLPVGGDIVTAPLDGTWAPLLASLLPGDLVTTSAFVGWRDVFDTIGGNPSLMLRGRIIAGNVDGTDAFSRRNPRTAVGYRADGTVLLVTVDGRGADGSVGMTLRELAELFVRLGATDALNLDGGGSTAMVVGRELQNVPSDGPERAVSSALIVRAGSRPAGGLRASGPTGADLPPEPLAPQDQADAERRSASDPGSTGGLRAHLRHGG